MMKSSALPISVACLIAFILGCEKTDDVLTPQPYEPAELSGTVGPAGGTLTSSDGRLSITIPAGALGAETNLSITEIDTTDVDAAFGDFAVHAALEMNPPDLMLTAPAEISFSFSALPGPQAAGKADDPQEYPLLLGILRTADVNSAPSQDLAYDLDPDTENNFTITAETMGWSQLVIGNPDDPSAKDNGYTKLTLEAEFKLSDDASTPLVEDRGSPFDLFVILRGSGGLTLGNPLMGSLPGQWHFYSLLLPGTPWEPEEVEELPESRTKYSWTVELYPGMAGDVKFTTSLEADLEFMNIPEMHLPLPDGATIGQSKIHLRAKPIHFLVSDPEPLPPSISIATGMTAPQGINVAYEVLNDPAPLGAPTDPWLYVAAYEGVKYYRLVKNQSHYIVSAELVGTITRANAAGVLPISGQGSTIERCLYIYEEEEFNYITYWNSTTGEYGMMLAHATPIADACAYGSINNSPGFSSAQRTRAAFLDFNPATGRFEGSPSLVSLFFTNSFPGLTGEIVSCIAHNTTRAALIVTSTGQMWYHARQDILVDGTTIGSAQSSPRQIRGVGDFYAISNSSSSTLTTFLWSGGASISNIQNTSVSAGPVGIDVRKLPDDSYLVVSTSAIHNTYTLSLYSSAGNYIDKKTYSVPETGQAPKYAVFVGLSSVPHVALSCFDSGTVEIIPVNLLDFEDEP